MDERETFRRAEWTIENFTCWSLQLHGNCIESAVPFLSDVKFILYPRGVEGNGDHLVARVCFSFHSTSTGDLSFVSSDDSLICTQQVSMEENLDVQLPLGPRLEEVVSRIRMNEPYHGDRFKLLFKAKSARDHTEKMHTVIDVFDTTLNLDPEVVGCGREISLIDYSTQKSHERLYLKSVRKGLKTELKLVPSIFTNEKCLVQSFVSLMKSNSKLGRCKELEHLCENKVPWTIVDSLNLKEMLRKGITLLLRLKIISGASSTQYFQKLFYAKGTSVVSNASSSKSPQNLDSFTSNQTDNSVEALSKDLMCLFQDQDFSDITLKCDNVSFPIHKNILSARSPVFKTMISIDMKEASSNEVVIEDLDPSTLSRFLTYIYTGKMSRSSEGHIYMPTTDVDSEGIYRCEVSTEAPFFQTVKGEKEMRIYVNPSTKPQILGIKSAYGIHELVNLTCKSGPSRPAAFLKWLINGEEVEARSRQLYRPPPVEFPAGMFTSTLVLSFPASPEHFFDNKVRVQCEAFISQAHTLRSEEITITNSSKPPASTVSHIDSIKDGPSISGGKSEYQVGDIVDVNCTAAKSQPPAELHWYINDKEARPELVIALPSIFHSDGEESTVLGLRFSVKSRFFVKGEMRLRCTATLSEVKKMTSEPLEVEIAEQQRSDLHVDQVNAESVQSCCRSWCGSLDIVSSLLTIMILWSSL